MTFPLDAFTYEPLVLPAFKNREEPDTVGVAMALEHVARIQLQQGAFTLHSSRIPLNQMNNASEFLCKFIIPNESVSAAFEELTLLGIRKYTLFLDLAALTSELKIIHPPHENWKQAF